MAELAAIGMITDLSRAIINGVRKGAEGEAAEILDGLAIGQHLRRRVALRLGEDVVVNMTLLDVCDYLLDEPENDG